MRRSVKTLLDRLGSLPRRIAEGPASGLWIYAPFSRARRYARGDVEPRVVDTLTRLIPESGVAIDVGAHYGYHALVMARRAGSAGRVTAFEAQPNLAGAIRRAARRNRLGQLEVVARAVAAEPGEALLEVSGNDSMARLLDGSNTTGRSRAVRATSLDTWAANQPLERLDLVKIDVEGGELDVLRGARQLLQRWRPALVVELHRRNDLPHHPEDVTAWLAEAGYRVEPLPRDGRARTLRDALADLAAVETPAGWMATLHIVARPRVD